MHCAAGESPLNEDEQTAPSGRPAGMGGAGATPALSLERGGLMTGAAATVAIEALSSGDDTVAAAVAPPLGSLLELVGGTDVAFPAVSVHPEHTTFAAP